MSEQYQQRANEVVEAFKAQLSKSGIEHVGQRHFEQLQLLIESALTSISLQQIEHTADRLQALSTELRNEAAKGRL